MKISNKEEKTVKQIKKDVQALLLKAIEGECLGWYLRAIKEKK